MNVYDLSDKYEKLRQNAVRHSLIQIHDNGKLTVEDCIGVVCFDENTVRLRLARGIVTITGLNLKMRNYSDRGIVITGSLHSIGFDSDGKDK
ncbi:MAG: YabP/YqfC family sporulation protein [Ruminiclostridium sp.]|nr:YabP/YqfC family sporulation protein [Ruminiclostridium sp.]